MGNFLKSIGNAITGGLPSLISGGINLIGSALGNKAGLKQQQLANDANMRLAQYKYEKDLEQWNRENDYNSPKSQMQRFADAGLNPNLIYGQGSSGNASSAPTYEAPHLEAYRNFGDMGASGAVAAFQNQQSLTADTALKESQRAKTDAEVVGQNLRNLNQSVQNARDYFEYGLRSKYGDQMMDAQLQSTWQALHTSESQQQVNLAHASVLNAQENLVIKQREHEIEKIGLTRAQAAVARMRIQEVAANADLLRKKAAALQYELETNPSVQKMSQLRDITTTLSILSAENDMDFADYLKWMEVIEKTSVAIGAGFSGFNSLSQGRKAWKLGR